MKIIRIISTLVLVVLLLVTGLYFYFLYSPRVPEPELSGTYEHFWMRVDELTRLFSVYRPKHLQGGAPVIFVLHGSTGSGEEVRQQSAYEFDQLAGKRDFLLVYPDGFEKHWNDCRGSADYAANTSNVDDPAFFSRMIDFLARRYNIDRTAVFVTGLSNGGHMAYRLALEKPGLVAAIAPMAAGLPVDANLDCNKSGQPVSVAIFNGTEDPVNPYTGGLVEILGNASRGAVLSAEDTAAYWRGLAGINQAPLVIEHPEADGKPGTSVVEQRWVGSDVEVRLYTLRGSGHVIPSRIASFPRLIGGDAADISGPLEIVNFFLGSR